MKKLLALIVRCVDYPLRCTYCSRAEQESKRDESQAAAAPTQASRMCKCYFIFTLNFDLKKAEKKLYEYRCLILLILKMLACYKEHVG
jgi:hypothetical protein